MKISFIGTGLMGLPMAQRLVNVGCCHLMAYNRTASKLAALTDAHIAQSPAAAIDHGDYIFLMLTDASAINTVLSPHINLLPGKTIIQMGTIAPIESQQLAQQVQQAGGEYLEAPVLGSIPEATTGQLLIMVGATPVLFDRVRPVLQNLGPSPLLIGEVGSAAALKLALNQMIAALTTGFAQSLAYLQQQGVATEAFMDILRSSALYAPTFDKKLNRMIDRQYDHPNFPTKHLAKDLDLFATSAPGLNLAGIQGLQEILREAIALGLADSDYASLYESVAKAKSPPVQKGI
jgi:3-hydroxyisobutyrate dehydrogenase